MTDAVARSSRITRRTFGVAFLAGAAWAGAETWPRWAFWQGSAGASAAALNELPQAAALKALGVRVLAATPATRAEIEAKLGPRLAEGGYDAAVARDQANGNLIAVDGWLIAETTTLAAGWLASAA
ncbi:hypothetical protein sos41_09500 [Alphaproteobacteria bacterium SO-S41]|nr:hypothetical protein sos41_09500 [Alphaproteobacteria bacterium SO-S41]